MSKKKAWGNFGLGFGAGLLEQDQRNDRKARQEKLDARDEALYDVRMRNENARFDDAQLERNDRNTLRTAAKPIVPEEDGSGGMVRPPEMDNRDVGLPENVTQPNMGLAAARYKVGGKQYATREEADAAAAPLNTPEASVRRYATAQTGLGDFKGAAATTANYEKTKAEQRSAAADTMMRDIGQGFMAGGWQGGTDVLSKSGGDGNDYKHEVDTKTGKVNILQVNRQSGAGRVIGSFDDNDAGKIDAYRMIGSAITKQPEIAAKHFEAKRKQANEERKLDQGDRKQDSVDQRTEYYGDYVNRPPAVRGGGGGGGGNGTDGASREERLRYTSLFNKSHNDVVETEKRIDKLTNGPNSSSFNRSVKRDPKGVEAIELANLQEQLKEKTAKRSAYEAKLAGSQTPAPAASTGPTNATERGMKQSVSSNMAPEESRVRLNIQEAEKSLPAVKDAAARKDLTNHIADMKSTLGEIERGKGGDKAKPSAISKPSTPKVGSVDDGYRYKGGNPRDKNNWEKV